MEKKKYSDFKAEIEDREMEIKKKIEDLKKGKYELARDCGFFIKTLDSIYKTIYEQNVFLLRLIDKNTKNEITLGIDDLIKISDKLRHSAKVLDVILEKELDAVYNKNFPEYFKQVE